jgi:hypothetical protein
VPSAGLRFAGESAFLVLVALGLGLAKFDALVIVVVMGVAWLLVALLERASSQEAARTRAAEPPVEEALPEPPPHVERIEVEPVASIPEEPAPEPEPEPEPEPAVSERSARALLASGPPPLPPEPPPKPASEKKKERRPKPKPPRRPLVERKPKPPRAAPPPPPPPPEPEPQPEPEPVVAGPPREWNLWELQRAVRDAGDGPRQEEWGALLIHLREFANADGDLPVEFDALVRESFGAVLAQPAESAAAS